MKQVIDFIGGEYRNRTGVHGFAIRCVTTPPTRLCGVNVDDCSDILAEQCMFEAPYCRFQQACPAHIRR